MGGIAFSIFIIGSFLYFQKGREKEAFNERIILFGYASILFSFACSLIFFILYLIFQPGVYRDFAFYIDESKPVKPYRREEEKVVVEKEMFKKGNGDVK